MKPFNELESWYLLNKPQTSNLFNTYQLQTKHIHLSIHHQNLDKNTFAELLQLANERQLNKKIEALVRGDRMNPSEQRPALHTALRAINSQPIFVEGQDITLDVLKTREVMSAIAGKLRHQEWKGYSGRAITDIVHIGIGGSDLGPRFCISALSDYCTKTLDYHFVSDIDPNSFEHATAGLNPETTLFIIASKSFTTEETLYNANKAFAFIGATKHNKNHFIAITANEVYARQLGIDTVLPIWDWVGGRFSLCSAINLITCIAIGYERFTELLAGANSMDRHFQHSPLEENLPIMMALVGILNINFLHIANLLILVYARQLEQFVSYVQQLDMESNGKSVDMAGRNIHHATGPIVWGGLGNQAQHSYYQLLCQGTHKIAADFISINSYENSTINHFCNAKIRTLTQGLKQELSSQDKIRGGMPINHIRLKAIDPFCLGELIALYEHKIFVQGILWGINSFDQPGVEIAKRFRKEHFTQELPA